MAHTKNGLLRIISAGQLFRTISSQSVSTLANQMVTFVIPWLVLDRTGSALDAGTVAFATGIAAVIGSLFGGIIVDRIGGRKTAIIADILSLVAVIILPIALFFDFVPLWLIIASQILGVLFDGPGKVARDALIPRTAKEDKVPLVRATSLQETLQGIATFVGPLAAGFLIAVSGVSSALYVTAGFFVLSAILIFGLRPQVIPRKHPLTVHTAYADMREAFVFLAKHPLLGPLTALLTVWIATIWPLSTIIFPAWFVFAGQGAGALGVFLGARALGGIIGGAAFAVIGPKVSGYKWFVVSGVITTVCMAGLLLTQPGSVLAVILSLLSGLAAAGQLPIINTAYYSRTPEHLLGRVNGAGWTLVLAVLPFTSLFYGWLTQITSPTLAILVVVASNALMVLIFGLLPAMRLIDRKPKN